MTRPSTSSGAEKTTSTGALPSTIHSPRKENPAMSPSSTTKSLRNASNRMWVQEQQKRGFIHHLSKWSLNHDSSLHFHGKISVTPQSTSRQSDFGLGKAVKCVLTDATFTDARQNIVIKLFPPQGRMKKLDGSQDRDTRRDSMDLGGFDTGSHQTPKFAKVGRQDMATMAGGHYKMVVRCGAGWMPAREYFNKVYCAHLEGARLTQDEYLLHRSQALGPRPPDSDSVTIRPLFHSFRKLPPELQEMVFMTAAGLSRTYNLCSDDYGTLKVKKDEHRSAISMSTLLRVSKRMNEQLLPYIYHSTDFQFGLTGFTNFLWQSGPTNRREIRRLTFHFGKLGLLHCIRWLAPDAIFSLFEPPVATNPRSLQYFWRCQIQDLVKDLNLFTLTLNIKQLPNADILMIVAIMKHAFGSMKKIHFIETDKNGMTVPVEMSDDRLKGLNEKHTWREMCLNYYQAHRIHSYFFKFELLKGQVEDLEDIMAQDEKFFDTAFSPMSPKEAFPLSA